MGKKRRGVFWAGIALAIFVVALFFAWKPLHLDEPWYRGKSLTGWLAVYGAGPGDYKPSPEADEALRHMGARAVPGLLRRLRATNSPPGTNAFVNFLTSPTPNAGLTNASLRVRAVAWVKRCGVSLFVRTPAPASWEHWKAYLGFQALGPEGRTAIPELLAMARDAATNSNPSGTGMAPNINFWKDKTSVAMFAAQSSTYESNQPPTGQYFWGAGSFVGKNVILVDGEIAAWSLAAMGKDSVSSLMDLLEDPNPRLKGRAAAALGMVGPDAEPAVPALIKAVGYGTSGWEAADALGWIDRRSDLVVPALVAALGSGDTAMKFTAMDSLGKFGEQASNAIPALVTEFSEGDQRFGQTAASALIKISRETTEKEVIPFLLDRIKSSPYSYTRALALETLGEAKYEPQLVVPVLMEAIDNTDKTIRIYGIISLGKMGPAASAAVPKLTVLTRDPDTNTSGLAAAALRAIQAK